MPVRNRRPDDEKPLFRAINEQRLFGPPRATTEAAQNGAGTQEQAAPRPTEEATQAAASSGGGAAAQAGGGAVSRALDRAEENNWVYPSVANALRRSGLVDKLDGLFG